MCWVRTWAYFFHAIFLTQHWDEKLLGNLQVNLNSTQILNQQIWTQIAITELRLLNEGGKFIVAFICFDFPSYNVRNFQ